MELRLILATVLVVVLVTIAQVDATSFVPTIGQQWPWSQWTTTEAPNKGGSRPRPTTTEWTTTEAPPPEVTFVPPLESEKDLLIVTDPNTGKMIYIPAKVFWERFGGSGWNPSNRPRSTTTTTTIPPPPPPIVGDTPRNPLICDFYAKNCWFPRTTTVKPRTIPSGGGASGSRVFGFPGFPSQSQRPGNGVGSLPPASRQPESMAYTDTDTDLESEFETSASNWPIPTISEFARFGSNNPGYYQSRNSQFNNRNRVYQPDLSSEASQAYDQRFIHRHYYPNTFKRGYEGAMKGSGIGGTLPENDATTLPPLIRVTRPSVFEPSKNEKITEETPK